MPPAATTTPSGDKRALTFDAAPTSRIWIAVCLASGGVILALCVFAGLGEILLAMERAVLEALFQPRGP